MTGIAGWAGSMWMVGEPVRHLAIGTVTMRADGIFHARFDIEADPTAEAALEYLAVRSELTGDRPVPVLVEIINIPFVERAIRGLFMSTMQPPTCRAVVTTDTTFRSMYKSFEILEEPKVPTEFFPTVQAAVDWIHSGSPISPES